MATMAGLNPSNQLQTVQLTASGVQYTTSLDVGVPTLYTKMTETGANFTIQNGQLNKLRLRPSIHNEHQESSREVMATVISGLVVGQVWKQSQDNINSFSMTLQSAESFASTDAITSGAGENKCGTMEYSSDGAMQAEYIKGGAVEAVRSAYTDDVGVTQDGSWAMKVPMDTSTDEWRVGLNSTNLTGVTFSMKYANTKEWNKAKLYFFIGDGTNTKSYPLSINTKDIWQTFSFGEGDMNVESTDDTATTPDMTAITKMGFRVDDSDASEFGYIDSIMYQADPGSVDFELWNLGTTLPASDGTVTYTSGTQYTALGDLGIAGATASSVRLDLRGGKQLYHIHGIIAGPALEIPSNELLTVGNYYAIVLKYVDTDVNVYGANTLFNISYYTNGYAWTAATGDSLIDIVPGASGSGAFSDCMFAVYSTQPIYINETEIKLNIDAGSGASFSIFVEDSDMKVTDIITNDETKFGDEHEEDVSTRPIYMGKGAKNECYYNDDARDLVDNITFEMRYYFEPPTVNG